MAVAGVLSAGGAWGTSNIINELELCKDTTGVAYVRHHLNVGSWKTAYYLYAFSGSDSVFNSSTSVRCY